MPSQLMRERTGSTSLSRPIHFRDQAARRVEAVSPAWHVLAKRYGIRDAAVRRLLALSDVIAVAISLWLALVALSSRPSEFLWALPTLPLWVVVFKAYGLYDHDKKRLSHNSLDDLPWIFHAVLVASLGLFAYYRITPPTSIDVSDLATFAALATVTIVSLRVLVRRLVISAFGPERVLLLGDGDEITTLARKMRSHPEYGVEPVGFVSRSDSPRGGSSLPLLGRFATIDLPDLIGRHKVERVVVSHEEFDEIALLDLLHGSHKLGIKVSVLPQLFDAIGPSLEVDDVEGITVLGINPPVLSRSSRLLKRSMDIAGAALLLVLTAPLQLLIAAAIKVESRGPVFFMQQRIGRQGRRFRLIKFRTMAVNAEERREALLADSRDPGWLLLDRDPRVTRVGRFLRLWSLDELPQLLNVIKGEMSLVGPRPIIESEDRQLEGWRRTRVDLTPGLTGLWQVLGRTSIPFEEMIKLDYLYVTNWSLWTDIRLMLRTLLVVMLRRGAN